MSEAIDTIQREIAKRRAEIEGLELALKVLTSNAPKEKQRALPPPMAPASSGMAEGNFTVNGVDLRLGKRELAVIEAIAAVEDCIPAEQLEPFCNGKRNYVSQTIWSLNKKLKATGAEIVFFKGEGYRLQNIDDGEERATR